MCRIKLLKKMFYVNILVSIVLILVFFYLFGLKSISRFLEKGVSQSLHEESPDKIPSPSVQKVH